MNSLVACLLASVLSVKSPAVSANDELREQAAQALRRATEFFRNEVATEGGYLWRYSEDLSRREGEGKATATQVWVQPPGTPSVGMAFLTAYESTGDNYYLEAARDAAGALVFGHLRSGGRYYFIVKSKRWVRLFAGNYLGPAR